MKTLVNVGDYTCWPVSDASMKALGLLRWCALIAVSFRARPSCHNGWRYSMQAGEATDGSGYRKRHAALDLR